MNHRTPSSPLLRSLRVAALLLWLAPNSGLAMPVPGEPLFAKTVNSAFIGTTLERHLREHGIGRLVIVGHTTDHCISTTARMAANLGFAVTVVADATATHERVGPDGAHHAAEVMHQLALASLHGEFAAIRTTAEVLSAS